MLPADQSQILSFTSLVSRSHVKKVEGGSDSGQQWRGQAEAGSTAPAHKALLHPTQVECPLSSAHVG